LAIPGFASVVLTNENEDALRARYGPSLVPYVDDRYAPVPPELSVNGLTHYERVLIIGQNKTIWYTAVVRSSEVKYPRCICTYCLTGWGCALCSLCANLPDGLHLELYRELSIQAEREHLSLIEIIARYYRQKPLAGLGWLSVSILAVSYAMGWLS